MMSGRKYTWLWGLIVLYAVSCTYDKNQIFVPPSEERTPTLEAAFVSSPPTGLNDPYWKTANYLELYTNEKESRNVYEEEGLLNMNNMYNGKADFNGGSDGEMRLKAAYDNNNLYILASWQDNSFNPSYGSWLYNGPNDPNKDDDSVGWTSQRNTDHLVLTFARANGHDIWKWSFATSEPVGYAIDMQENGAGWINDGGTPVYERNAVDPDDYRSGPKYEWNGPQQELTRIPDIPQSFAQLDAGYFILNKAEFKGDVVKGDLQYQNSCAFCHGSTGDGNGHVNNTGVAVNAPGRMNRFTREGLGDFMGNADAHQGYRYWNGFSDEQKDDVIARLRAFAGVPGVVFQEPSGSSADIRAYSNIILGNIDVDQENAGYSVLFIRKLQTGNDDDIQFNLGEGSEYDFNVRFSDDDDLNFVGEDAKKLTFIRK